MSEYGFTVSDLVRKGRLNHEDILQIRDWVQTEQLPNFPDETLALFFLACQNDFEATKKCTLAYYQIRMNSPELFDDRIITREDIQHQLKILNFCIFPERTDSGQVVLCHRLVNFDASQYDMEVAMKLVFMTIDAAVHDDPPTGIITLFDMRGVGIRHLTRIKLGALKKFFYYTQEALPLRLCEIHVMNVVWFVDRIMKLIKPFMKPDILQNLHLHTSDVDMEDFYRNHIPRRCLPIDYGGDLDSVDELQKLTVQKMTDMQPFFEREQIMRTKL